MIAISKYIKKIVWHKILVEYQRHDKAKRQRQSPSQRPSKNNTRLISFEQKISIGIVLLSV